jgi:hypothetical protein
MSDASDSAHVRIVIADYGIGDQAGKMTLVGAGVSIIPLNPSSGTTVPFTVWASASFAPVFVGENPAVELSLETTDGELVQMPGIAGGESQALRVAVAEALRPTVMQGAEVDQDAVRPKTQILLQFQTGLPLAAGHAYRWRVRIDGDTRDEWTELLFIPTASAGPVLG